MPVVTGTPETTGLSSPQERTTVLELEVALVTARIPVCLFGKRLGAVGSTHGEGLGPTYPVVLVVGTSAATRA